MLPSGPKAYVYAPSGSIMPIEAGTQFKDGRAKKITIDAVTFDAGGKDVVLALR
jgi:hypothetical protein